MQQWLVDERYDIDFNEAPVWATKVAWRRVEAWPNTFLVRAWVDELNTKYQYLHGFSGIDAWGVTILGNFFSPRWMNDAQVIASKVFMNDNIPNIPMVCHDKYGFMTDDFKKYTQLDWDTIRDQAKAIAARAISHDIDPIAMKEMMLSAIDCGVTLAKVEAKVNDAKK